MSALKKWSKNFGSGLAKLGIGKTKILTEAVRAPRPIPLQFWRDALTCSPPVQQNYMILCRKIIIF